MATWYRRYLALGAVRLMDGGGEYLASIIVSTYRHLVFFKNAVRGSAFRMEMRT